MESQKDNAFYWYDICNILMYIYKTFDNINKEVAGNLNSDSFSAKPSKSA
jgi:hypothetical protein